jgi:MFS family permease
MVATPVASLIGSPIRGALLYTDGMLGLGGWQWIFLLEAIPTVLLGIAAFGLLTDRPEHATWLDPEQRRWLAEELARERRQASSVEHKSVWQIITNKYVLLLALIYTGASGAAGALPMWLPQLFKSYGLSNWHNGLVSAVPFGVAAVAMILWARSSDAIGERVWHNALPLVWIVLAIVGTFFAVHSVWVMLPLLVVIAVGAHAGKGPFWALSSEWLGSASAAAGLAQINALGNLSSFLFNYLIGWIDVETGSFPLAFLPIALVSAIGALAVLVVGLRRPRTAG